MYEASGTNYTSYTGIC